MGEGKPKGSEQTEGRIHDPEFGRPKGEPKESEQSETRKSKAVRAFESMEMMANWELRHAKGEEPTREEQPEISFDLIEKRREELADLRKVFRDGEIVDLEGARDYLDRKIDTIREDLERRYVKVRELLRNIEDIKERSRVEDSEGRRLREEIELHKGFVKWLVPLEMGGQQVEKEGDKELAQEMTGLQERLEKERTETSYGRVIKELREVQDDMPYLERELKYLEDARESI
ncbi:MAG: hypothetical protein HQ530_02690 [Parcubacteria group bacterium]|nr:hypothetical protein [Parcubacteria group bacterium]